MADKTIHEACGFSLTTLNINGKREHTVCRKHLPLRHHGNCQACLWVDNKGKECGPDERTKVKIRWDK